MQWKGTLLTQQWKGTLLSIVDASEAAVVQRAPAKGSLLLGPAKGQRDLSGQGGKATRQMSQEGSAEVEGCSKGRWASRGAARPAEGQLGQQRGS